MKNLKLAILALGVLFLGSCELFQDDTTLDLNSAGPNLASFEKENIVYSQVATGDEYTFDVFLKIKGPTSMDLTEDVTVTFDVDDSSTAIEGTHYRINDSSVKLTKAGNYLGKLSVTMLTAGIVAPLPADPTIVLYAKANGTNVTGNGKPAKIKLVYGCLSHFEGTYDVTTEYTGYDGSVTTLNWTEEITKTGIEEYRTGRVGHWSVSSLGGNPGFTFYNKCDELSVPGQNLVDTYSNWVEGTATGSADGNTLFIEYSICVTNPDKCRYYKSTYVKQ